MLLMEAQKTAFPEAEKSDIFIVSMGEKATLKAVEIANDLSDEGLSAQFDTIAEALKRR